jgi:hypothetical protein
MTEREELAPVEAGQGFIDRPVLIIFITAMAMVGLVFVVLLLSY